MQIIKQNIWPIVGILFLTFLIGILNYKSGTILTGGDNLHPEFYPEMNLKRTIFTTWQEYQGVGLLGGMGHGADLVRQVVLYPFYKLVPMNEVRYWYTILTLGVGGIGAYFFIRKILRSLSHQGHELVSFVGASFYILNLSTLQSYFTAFETFTAHFAVLPWLLLSFLMYFEKPNKKNVLILTLILVLATPHAYVPTLFVVFLLATAVMLPFVVSWKHKATSLRTILKYYVLVFALNAFWMLPFAYFTLTNSAVNVAAKINQMATENIFLQNKEFGNIFEVMLLRGFWFNNVDFTISGETTYMLLDWRVHLSNPLVLIVGYLLFGTILAGIIYAVKKRTPLLLGVLALFLVSFTMLATNTPPFSFINMLIRELPLVNQIFRFPFTKFSILASLMYSVFLSVGLCGIINLAKTRINSKFVPVVTSIVAIVLILVFVLPIFQGKLFYDREQVELPTEYTELFDYFKSQDPNTRIANFPQHTFWGWYFYDWGYTGSGFLWYGIKQPILDRAFDVWSAENENYYYELSNAIYKKDPAMLDAVLNKYQINWLLVDKHIVHPLSPKSLFTSELESMISELPNIQKEKTFGDIEVYSVKLENQPKDFLFTTPILPQASTSGWSEFDSSYNRFGNYINDDQKFQYPLNDLFSKREPLGSEKIIEQKNSLIFNRSIPALPQGGSISIPSFLNNESYIPAQLIATPQENGSTSIDLIIKGATIQVNGETVLDQTTMIPLFVLPRNSQFPVKANINGTHTYAIKKPTTGQPPQDYTFLTLNQDNLITLSDENESYSQVIPSTLLFTEPVFQETVIPLAPSKSQYKLSIRYPKITDPYISLEKTAKDNIKITKCNDFQNGDLNSNLSTNAGNPALRIATKDSSACLSFYSATMPHNTGYTIFAESKNVVGRGFHFWILNEDSQYAPIDLYLPNSQSSEKYTLALAPMEQFGRSYSFHLDNISVGNNNVENEFRRIAVYPIPYAFLNLIMVENSSPSTIPAATTNYPKLVSTTHPQESLYTATLNIPANSNGMLILSQGYNSGWKAYAMDDGQISFLEKVFPFFFGEKIDSHTKINNWENGWILENPEGSDNQTSIIIVYLPQYLQYVGFIVLGGTLLSITVISIRKNS